MIFVFIMFIFSKGMEKEWLESINNYRKQNNAGPLSINTKLEEAAIIQTKHQLNTRQMSHSGPPDMPMLNNRVEKVGFKYSSIGENVATGFGDDFEEVFTGWKNSEDHNANILNPDFLETGLSYESDGESTTYWTHVFGTSRDKQTDNSGNSSTNNESAHSSADDDKMNSNFQSQMQRGNQSDRSNKSRGIDDFLSNEKKSNSANVFQNKNNILFEEEAPSIPNGWEKTALERLIDLKIEKKMNENCAASNKENPCTLAKKTCCACNIS